MFFSSWRFWYSDIQIGGFYIYMVSCYIVNRRAVMTVIMTTHWTVSFRSARQVHVLFSSTGPRGGCAICTHSHRNACTSKKVWKQTLPWPLGFYDDRPDRTGVSRRIYTHIKRRGKRFHYSFVYGMPRLCTVQRLLREKSGCVTKGRNVVRAPSREWEF